MLGWFFVGCVCKLSNLVARVGVVELLNMFWSSESIFSSFFASLIRETLDTFFDWQSESVAEMCVKPFVPRDSGLIWDRSLRDTSRTSTSCTTADSVASACSMWKCAIVRLCLLWLVWLHQLSRTSKASAHKNVFFASSGIQKDQIYFPPLILRALFSWDHWAYGTHPRLYVRMVVHFSNFACRESTAGKFLQCSNPGGGLVRWSRAEYKILPCVAIGSSTQRDVKLLWRDALGNIDVTLMTIWSKKSSAYGLG